jgi:hypothetical protein
VYNYAKGFMHDMYKQDYKCIRKDEVVTCMAWVDTSSHVLGKIYGWDFWVVTGITQVI